MATRASLHLFLILSLFACSTVKSTVYPLSRKEILNSFHNYKVVKHDLANQQPLTNPVTNPAATPVTPLQNPAPPVITVPATNPIGVVAPNPPVAQTSTPVTPVTNPVTTPTNPGAQPVTNPVTTPTTPPATTANPTPAATTNAPPAVSGSGQSWCVAKSGLTETALQSALDYACGVGGIDCSAIQQSGSCYNPNTLQNHASFAFNAYYQKNPAPTSCDFGGAASVTNQNPSSVTCVYPTSSSSSSGTPSTMPSTTPSNGATVPAGNTSSAPPNLLNSSSNYPPLGGTSTGGITGSASPPADASDLSVSNHLQAVLGSITLLAFITSTVLIY